ncbi:MAG: hypothetical protein JSW73_00160 [Candidatus Woesearchaeota archaeon]|nr:MAG: hypothetical protein JSW73_00160 [Candidatus Woesearchaeota archaeon]
MEYITTSNSGLEQRINLFQPSLDEKQVNLVTPTIINEEELLKKHKEEYSDSIRVPDWKEVLFVLKGRNPTIDPSDLEVIATTSYHIQAIEKEKDITPVALDGLILTNDNKFVYGVRGGNVERDKACICPAGYLSIPNKSRNPLFASFYKELTEELGIDYSKQESTQLLGYQTDPDFTKGIHFIFYLPTTETAHELDEIHKNAIKVYEESISEGNSVAEARKAIKDNGFSNIDAWEHTKLLFVDNNPKTIQKIIDTRNIQYKNKAYPLLDIGRGPLILYSNL